MEGDGSIWDIPQRVLVGGNRDAYTIRLTWDGASHGPLNTRGWNGGTLAAPRDLGREARRIWPLFILFLLFPL